MNFAKVFLLFAVILVVLNAYGNVEAGWLKKVGKKIEKVGRNTRKAAEKTLDLAQKAAVVVPVIKAG